MARARLLHPEFARHEGLAELSHTHRLLFAMLPTIADREGLLEDRPRRIKADLFPYDTDQGADVENGLNELARIGCIQRTEIHGRKVITIPGFLRWNKPHPREKKSELSDPPAITKQHGSPKANPRPTKGGKSPSVSVSVSVSDPVSVPVPDQKQKLREGAAAQPAVAPAVVLTPPPGKLVPIGATNPVWDSYAEAYRKRYGSEPVRNATVNGQLAAIVRRIGAEEAPAVAAFYVGHGKAYYVTRLHSVKAFLGDCEALRTEWFTGRRITNSEARQIDRSQENADGWSELLREKPA